MMTREEIHNRLEAIFQMVFEDDSIKIFDEMTAVDIDRWDSMEHINLIVACEREFNVKFAMAQIADLPNVGALEELIFSKVSRTR